MTTTTTTTPEQVKAAFAMVQAIAETIKELGQAPAGTLYAHLMGRMSLEGFNKIVGLLERQGLVRREPSHLLVWIGPK